MTDKAREMFEQEWRKKWPNDSRDIFELREGGTYRWEIVQVTWEGFKMGRAGCS